MASRVCAELGCPTVYPKAEGPRCPAHRRDHERTRGTRQQRGYTSEHDRLRARWAPTVQLGTVTCPRCSQLIAPDSAWDLGHTDNRKAWTGPEHARCNRAAGGRSAHPQPRRSSPR